MNRSSSHHSTMVVNLGFCHFRLSYETTFGDVVTFPLEGKAFCNEEVLFLTLSGSEDNLLNANNCEKGIEWRNRMNASGYFPVKTLRGSLFDGIFQYK